MISSPSGDFERRLTLTIGLRRDDICCVVAVREDAGWEGSKEDEPAALRSADIIAARGSMLSRAAESGYHIWRGPVAD